MASITQTHLVGCAWQVADASMLGEDGQPTPVKVLIFTDPATGCTWHVPFELATARDIARALTGGIEIAHQLPRNARTEAS